MDLCQIIGMPNIQYARHADCLGSTSSTARVGQRAYFSGAQRLNIREARLPNTASRDLRSKIISRGRKQITQAGLSSSKGCFFVSENVVFFAQVAATVDFE